VKERQGAPPLGTPLRGAAPWIPAGGSAPWIPASFFDKKEAKKHRPKTSFSAKTIIVYYAQNEVLSRPKFFEIQKLFSKKVFGGARGEAPIQNKPLVENFVFGEDYYRLLCSKRSFEPTKIF
jgi:hypothetical protein